MRNARSRAKRAEIMFQEKFGAKPERGFDYCSAGKKNCDCGLPTKKELTDRVIAGNPIWTNERSAREM